MKQNEIINKIIERFPSAVILITDDKQFSITVDENDAVTAVAYMQMLDFKQLAIITAVDWIEKGKFEIVYNLFSYEHLQQVFVKTLIDRKNPKIQSISNLWEVAGMYERDVHEFFGVEFVGNNDLRPLILHNWQDKPPMRKDFDSEAYSNKVFGNFKKEKAL